MSRNRALFWPAALILVGVLALLVNAGVLPTDRLYRLWDLWPLAFIVVGLELVINRSRLPAAVETTASVLVVVVALIGAGLYVALGPALPGGTHTKTFSETASELNKQAALEVDVGAATVHAQGSSSMVEDLFQAQITYSGPEPTLSFDQETGRVVISQKSTFGLFATQSFHMDVQLNTGVSWGLAVNSGASEVNFDVSNLTLRSIGLNTGASTDNLTLPHPQGSVPIDINGGALTVHMHRPPDTAASVTVSGGGLSLDFDGRHTGAIGSASDSTGTAADMFRVSINGGGCTVTMDTGSAG